MVRSTVAPSDQILMFSLHRELRGYGWFFGINCSSIRDRSSEHFSFVFIIFLVFVFFTPSIFSIFPDVINTSEDVVAKIPRLNNVFSGPSWWRRVFLALFSLVFISKFNRKENKRREIYWIGGEWNEILKKEEVNSVNLCF